MSSKRVLYVKRRATFNTLPRHFRPGAPSRSNSITSPPTDVMTLQPPAMLNVLGRALGCLQRIGSVSKFGDGDSGNGEGDECPPLGELDERFNRFVAEMDLDHHHEHILLNLDSDKKWQLLREESHRQNIFKQECSVSHYVEFLELAVKDSLHFYEKEANCKMAEERLESLRIALRTRPNSFVTQFLDNNGLELMFGILSQIRVGGTQPHLMTSLLGCVKSLLNNSNGRASVLNHRSAVRAIAHVLHTEPVKPKTSSFEILGAICLIPGGHKIVLDAMHYLQQESHERFRFQKAVLDLDRRIPVSQSVDPAPCKDEWLLKTGIMSFINALLKCGDAEASVELRIHVRHELLMLGLQNTIDHLRDHPQLGPVLENHLDLFEMMRQEDEEEFGRKFDDVSMDPRQPVPAFQALVGKVEPTDAMPHLCSVTNHLLMFPIDKCGVSYWRLLDRICQQIALQLPSGQDPDIQALELDFHTTMKQLDLENELDRAHEEIDALQEKLADAHRQLSAVQQTGSSRCLAGLKSRRSMSPTSLDYPSRHRDQDVQSVSSGVESVGSDEQNAFDMPNGYGAGGEGDPTSPLGEPAQQLGSQHSLLKSSIVARLGGIVPPPPPLPPPMSLFNQQGESHTWQRKVPKPQRPLKTFNWLRIPEDKLDGTIWLELNEEHLYSKLDLEDFCEKFAALPRSPSDEDGTPDAPDPYDTLRYTPKRLSVIDPRRAQNLNILLSKFKLRNSDVVNAILTMDSGGVLPKDLTEQLLKFMPTPEELSLLADYRAQAHSMARADRFMIDISAIPRYEDRIKCIYFQTIFNEKIHELKPKIDVVTKASRAMLNSKRLRRLLELVLALGNYMNYGKRWKEAAGFQLSALSILGETRSAANKDYTLLHYLVEMAENNFPELLRMKRELNVVTDASKISWIDLETELQSLTSGIMLARSELVHLKSKARPGASEDEPEMTVTVGAESELDMLNRLQTFLTLAVPEVNCLEQRFKEMKTSFGACVKKFGGKPESASPDEMFRDVACFLQSFTATYRKIQAAREEEERRKRTMTKIQNRPRFGVSPLSGNAALSRLFRGASVPPGTQMSVSSSAGEFDQLVSALQSGELFNEELKRLRTSFRGSSRFKKSRRHVSLSPEGGGTSPMPVLKAAAGQIGRER